MECIAIPVPYQPCRSTYLCHGPRYATQHDILREYFTNLAAILLSIIYLSQLCKIDPMVTTRLLIGDIVPVIKPRNLPYRTDCESYIDSSAGDKTPAAFVLDHVMPNHAAGYVCAIGRMCKVYRALPCCLECYCNTWVSKEVYRCVVTAACQHSR